jgi:hypothetical protein
MRKQFIFLITFLVVSLYYVNGQQVTTTLDPARIQIGEHAKYTLRIGVPAKARLHMPVFNEQLHEKVEIIDYGSSDSLSYHGGNRGTTVTRTLTLTSWEEGFHAIAPVEFLIITDSDTTRIESEAVLLEVIPYELDEQSELRDIKPIFKVPITLAELKWYILGAVLFALLAWVIYKYIKSRKKAPVAQSIWEKPDVPAHIAALSSLEHLKSQRLWQQGKVKEYHIELNNIMRHYLEKRFSIPAMEMTTSEILPHVRKTTEMQPIKDELEWMLYLSDMVKFARFVPSGSENEKCMDIAFEMVEITRPHAPEQQQRD